MSGWVRWCELGLPHHHRIYLAPTDGVDMRFVIAVILELLTVALVPGYSPPEDES